jgi:hypothetical protein
MLFCILVSGVYVSIYILCVVCVVYIRCLIYWYVCVVLYIGVHALFNLLMSLSPSVSVGGGGR